MQRSVLILLMVSMAVVVLAKNGTTQSSKGKAASKTTTPAGPPAAILHTTAGDMKCVLFPDKAAKTVENFIGLAMGTKDWTNPATQKVEHRHPLYDGVIFHRVIPGFMIQGGDPAGTGTGGPGYQFEDELLPDLLFDKPGRLAMANSGADTNGSQFFITEKEQPSLDPCFQDAGCQRPYGTLPNHRGWTIFGQCDDATVSLVKKIAQGPCRGQVCDGSNSRPDQPVKITHIEILNPPKPPAKQPSRKKTSGPAKAPTSQ
jgi:cyclophilin family peptidyl-prolyl cis-trans isomerase